MNRSDHPLYKTWKAMCHRCYNEKMINYHLYGGRGITVCREWQEDFWQFVHDMGERPENHTLGRIDNNGNYEPFNCEWVTATEQQRNITSNHLITYQDETLPMMEWCERLNLHYNTVNSRINRYNWDIERALSTPTKSPYKKWYDL